MSDLNPTKKVKIQHSRNAWQAADDGKLHPDDNSGYVLPVATKTVLGGMRVGDRLSVTPLGTVSADDQHYDDTEIREEIDAKQDELVSGETLRTVNGHSLLGAGNLVIEGGEEYTLPPATATELGGVKKGARVSIAADGTLSADDQTFDPTALQTQITGNTQGIVDANARIDGKQDTLVSGTSIKTVNGESLLGAGNLVIGGGGGDYTLPPATSETLGGVKTGARVTIALDGTLSADDQHYDDTAILAELAGKQPTLVSGLTLKTVNGTSLLGAGNLVIDGEGGSGGDYVLPVASATELGGVRLGTGDTIAIDGTGIISAKQYDDSSVLASLAGKQPTLVSGTTIKTVNGQSLLGSGNVQIDADAPLASDTVAGLVKVGKGLEINGGSLVVRSADSSISVFNDGLWLNLGGTMKKEGGYIEVDLRSAGALVADFDGGIYVNVDNAGIKIDGNNSLALKTDAVANTLKVGAGGASVKIGDGTLQELARGLAVNRGQTIGVASGTGALEVKTSTSGGLTQDSTGVKANLGTTLDVNALNKIGIARVNPMTQNDGLLPAVMPSAVYQLWNQESDPTFTGKSIVEYKTSIFTDVVVEYTFNTTNRAYDRRAVAYLTPGKVIFPASPMVEVLHWRGGVQGVSRMVAFSPDVGFSAVQSAAPSFSTAKSGTTEAEARFPIYAAPEQQGANNWVSSWGDSHDPQSNSNTVQGGRFSVPIFVFTNTRKIRIRYRFFTP